MIKKVIKKIIIIIIVMNLIISNYNIIYAKYYEDENDEENILNSIDAISNMPDTINKDEKLKINSKYAVVLERKNKEILYEKNSEKLTAMASTTKIMTAIIIVENEDLTETVTISKKAAGTGGSRLGLKYNDKITVKDLLYGLMLRSGNDAAIALAEHLSGNVESFVNKMNLKAKELKFKTTNFVTPHGLDNERHYINARELALLTDYALRNDIFKKIVGTKSIDIKINGVEKKIVNTNELLGNYEGVYGVKTGFTNKAGRCLVTSIKINGLDLVIVVLGADTKKDRTKDSIKIIRYIEENFIEYDIKEKIEETFKIFKMQKKQIAVEKGRKNIECENDVKLDKIQKEIMVIKKEGKKPEIYMTVKKKVGSPIDKETIIGKIVIKNEDKIFEEINIVTNKKINKKNLNDYFFIFLTNMY